MMKREFRCERKEVDIEIEGQRTREIYEGESLWGGPGSPLKAQIFITINTLAAILPSHAKVHFIVTIEEITD